MPTLEERIADAVDCGCCPINEDAVKKVAAFARHTYDSELDTISSDMVPEFAAIYEYERWLQSGACTRCTA